MKTWIIILLIAWIVFRFIMGGIKNYIQNDKTERVKYYFTDGATTLGLWYGIFALLYKLTFWADVILVIIYVLNGM